MSAHPRYAVVMPSPLGMLGVSCESGAVTCIDYLDANAKAHVASDPFAQRVHNEMKWYFSSSGQPLNLAVKPRGTPFQQRVWSAMQRIPPGQVLTYGELAEQLGSGPRAVGGACRRNPIPIIVPCHRVVAKQGLGGYSGDTQGPGLQIKRWLLTHEGFDIDS